MRAFTPEEDTAHPILKRLVRSIEDLKEKTESLTQRHESDKVPEDWLASGGGMVIPALAPTGANFQQNNIIAVCGRRTNRYRVQINNQSSGNDCYYGNTATYNPNNPTVGWVLLPKGTNTGMLPTKAPIFVWSTSGTTVDVLEFVYSGREVYDYDVDNNVGSTHPASYIKG